MSGDISGQGQALRNGTLIEEFLIERVLGAGGFGVTYLAIDTSLGRQVVIKENLPSQFAFRDISSGTVSPRNVSGGDADDYEWSLQNFLREAETLASLDHAGIVRVLRKFEANGTAYFVMPYIEGITLEELIRDRHSRKRLFSEEEIVGLAENLISALIYLHHRGIYHRDIKPANILISNEGVPVLIDFGSARQNIADHSMTVIESAGYTPFEQLQSRGNIGPWSDLYSLGATLCKVITSQAPPKAADRVIEDPWPRLSPTDGESSYSKQLLDIINKALSINPKDRWQNAQDWRDEMRITKAQPPLSLLGQDQDRVESSILDNGIDDQTIVLEPDKPSTERIQEKLGSDTLDEHYPNKTYNLKKIGVIVVAIVLVLISIIVSYESDEEFDPINPDEKLLIKLSHSGNAYAQAHYGYLLCFFHEDMQLHGSHKPAEEGEKWIRKSAENGHPLGHLLMCILEEDSEDNEQLNSDSITSSQLEEYGQKAIDAGLIRNADSEDPLWCLCAGLMFANGWGIKADNDKAIEWLAKSSSYGDSNSMFHIAEIYEGASSDESKPAQALYWYEKSARAGNLSAMNKLGVCYESGYGVNINEAEAVRWYRRAADNNHPIAITNLALCYLNGIGVRVDEEKAYGLLKKAAVSGSSRAMRLEGFCCQFGYGTEKNPSKAIFLYQKASDLGDAESMYFLGICYYEGIGVKTNRVKAYELYKKAAKLGNVDAMASLADCYSDGHGTVRDSDQAYAWYSRAAESGNQDAMNSLGYCYAHGIGTNQNYNTASAWYKKSADAGSAHGIYNLSMCYKYGQGVVKNIQKSFRLVNKAADNGHYAAMVELGNFHQHGWAGNKDLDAAYRWYKKAVEEGENVNGFYPLAMCYFDGSGVYGNQLEAAKLLEQGAIAGNKNCINMLGYCYERGLGVRVDADRAVMLYQKAGGAGHDAAMYNLGRCYENGIGSLSKNLEESFKWYRKSAKAGNKSGMFAFARCYNHGIGTIKNPSTAFVWYRDAAKAGHTDAMNVVGIYYLEGTTVVARNVEKAVAWYKKASDAGNVHASYNLAICYSNGDGVKKNQELAIELLNSVIKNGETDLQEKAMAALKRLTH